MKDVGCATRLGEQKGEQRVEGIFERNLTRAKEDCDLDSGLQFIALWRYNESLSADADALDMSISSFFAETVLTEFV